MGIVEFLGSAAFGGITGLFGGIINRVADYFTTKERYKHEQVMIDKNTEYLRIETDRDIQIAKEQANAVKEAAGLDAMAKSYDADRATYLSPALVGGLPPWAQSIVAIFMAFVDFVRGMTRPGLTLYLCVLTTIMYMEQKAVLEALGVAPSPDAALGLTRDMIHGVIYLTTMAVGWWFATRAKRSEP